MLIHRVSNQTVFSRTNRTIEFCRPCWRVWRVPSTNRYFTQFFQKVNKLITIMSLEPFLHFKHKKYAFGGQNQPYDRIYQGIKDWAGDLAQALDILELLAFICVQGGMQKNRHKTGTLWVGRITATLATLKSIAHKAPVST